MKQNFLNVFQLFIIGLILVAPYHGLAQKKSGITVVPAIIEQYVTPGQRLNLSISVANGDSQPQTYFLIKKGISSLTPNGTPVYSDDPLDAGVTTWITDLAETVTINPDQRKEVQFTIIVPQDVGPGVHIGSIFASLQPPKVEGIAATVGYQVGSLIVLKVKGEVNELLRFRSFVTDQFIYSSSSVKFLTSVENGGNVLLRPRGPIDIIDMFGKKVGTVIMNEGAAAVLPGGTRIFETTWEGDGATPGRYTAVLSMGYGEVEKQTVSRFTSFWVLPMEIIVPSVTGIVGLVLLIVLFARWYVRYQMRSLVGKNGFTKRETASSSSSSLSRLATVALVLMMMTLILLVVLFFLFA